MYRCGTCQHGVRPARLAGATGRDRSGTDPEVRMPAGYVPMEALGADHGCINHWLATARAEHASIKIIIY